jgi:organic radical activating enzyme
MSAVEHAADGRLTHREVERIRRERGRSILLFVTDRCPVGCKHCSVDSRPDSPTIQDFALFEEIIDWIEADSGFDVVGISGGEPFVERRGLSLACRRLSAAGKRIVIFTSGIWARQERVPHWIGNVLERCATIYLSTDAFHGTQITDAEFVRAARTIVAAGPWLVVQGLDDAETAARIVRLLTEALGADWSRHAEINLIAPLANGRGAAIFSHEPLTLGADFGPCTLVRNPMVRYDGVVSACCNESVIMGFGPARLRRRAATARELAAAAGAFHADPLLRVIGETGFGSLTQHPELRDLADKRFGTNCELCWKALARMPDPGRPDRLVSAMAALQVEDVS